ARPGALGIDQRARELRARAGDHPGGAVAVAGALGHSGAAGQFPSPPLAPPAGPGGGTVATTAKAHDLSPPSLPFIILPSSVSVHRSAFLIVLRLRSTTMRNGER